MDYDELIERLRTDSLYADKESLEIMDLCMDAATAIETLRADLSRMTAERDAAISDLTYIARTYPVELCDDLVCQYCKHYPNANTGCPGWTENDCFEWRGQKED